MKAHTALLASSVNIADDAAASEPGSVRSPQNRDYKRIATEEACSVYEIFQAQNEYLEKNPDAEPGLRALRKHYAGIGQEVGPLLGDLGEGRIAYMDKHGIHKQIMVLGAPGVQIFDAPQAIELSRLANDRLADAVKKNPDRLEAMTVIPPQAPEAVAQELERGVNKLGLKGAIINSHTRGEYLDKRKFYIRGRRWTRPSISTRARRRRRSSSRTRNTAWKAPCGGLRWKPHCMPCG